MIVLPAMPMRNPQITMICHEQVFTSEECARIVISADAKAWRAGGVGGHDTDNLVSVVAEARSCTEQRLPLDQRSGYPLNKIEQVISQMNCGAWRFDLSGFVNDDMPYLMRYEGSKGDHNDWHVDMGRAYSASRKLGFSLQLTDAAAYEGGALEFQHAGIDPEVVRRQGTIIVFPTFCLHRIAPMISGVRHVVVGWMHGPTFR